MTRDQKIGAIRKACIGANLKIGAMARDGRRMVPVLNYGRPIRLADVIHALVKADSESVTEKQYLELLLDNTVGWDMPKDDLSLQSEECVSFIHSLLT